MDRFFQRLKWNLDRAFQALRAQLAAQAARAATTAQPVGDAKVIVICPNCSQKLRIPLRRNRLIVTCTACRREFPYQYYGLGFSSSSHRPLMVGLLGGLLVFIVLEVLLGSLASTPVTPLLLSILVFSVIGLCLGALMGAAEGFFHRNSTRRSEGLRYGGLFGLLGGMLAGLVAHLLNLGMLSIAPDGSLSMLARLAAWAVLGFMTGGAYGLKENTVGDLMYGLMGGLFGGAVGGLLFELFSAAFNFGDGSLGGLLGFLALGMLISVAVSRVVEIGLSQGSREMFQPLTQRLPANARLRPNPGGRPY